MSAVAVLVGLGCLIDGHGKSDGHPTQGGSLKERSSACTASERTRAARAQCKQAALVLGNAGGDTAPRLNCEIRTVVVEHVP
jgi:hypothetical protein